MALNITAVDLRGVLAEPIIAELVFENHTLADELVTFQDDIKSSAVFSENGASVTMQPFTSGIPASAGSFDSFDTLIVPVIGQFHHEFDPTGLRLSSWKRNLKPGAYNFLPDDYTKLVIGGVYAKKISYDAENKFWNHATATYKTAVAGLTPSPTGNTSVSANEQALVAASPTVTGLLFNGVIQYMIYNASNAASTFAVGGRNKVVGTTITSINIRDEYNKLFIGIPPVTLENVDGDLYWYAPKSHRQLIAIYNSTPSNYQSGGFAMDGTNWTFNGIPIKFCPLPENCMIAASRSYINWCTDLASDISEFKLDQWDKRTQQWFVQTVFTIFAHVTNQKFNALYVG